MTSWIELQLAWIKPLGMILAAILAAISLMDHLDNALMAHLDSAFATRTDLQHTEDRLTKRLESIERKLDGRQPRH